jgi:Ca2+-binding RTX toxin-like protein
VNIDGGLGYDTLTGGAGNDTITDTSVATTGVSNQLIGGAGNYTTTTSYDTNYPVLSNYGSPSNTIAKDGGGEAYGGDGTQGAVEIIWLYD